MGVTCSLQEVISMMINKFNSDLREPESIIVQQFDKPGKNVFYLIAKGACDVKAIDEKKNSMVLKTMRNGEFFGEISLIYGCKRTATVCSLKYSTLATLTKKNYQEILLEYPDLESHLKNFIYKYNDRMKRFILKGIS